MKTSDQQTVTMGRRPMDSLLARIVAASALPDKIIPGFKTTVEWARAWGMSPPNARRRITDGLRYGILVRRNFRVVCRGGVALVPVPHYGPAKNGTT